jgi:hypothetical protein
MDEGKWSTHFATSRYNKRDGHQNKHENEGCNPKDGVTDGSSIVLVEFNDVKHLANVVTQQ